MKKGAIFQLTIVLFTFVLCILGVLFAILSTKEETALDKDILLNSNMNHIELEILPADEPVSEDFDSFSNDVLDNTPLPDSEDIFIEDLSHKEDDVVEVELPDTQSQEEVLVEHIPIKPSSTYISNYEGALISFEQEDIELLDDYLWEFGEDVAVYFYDIHSKVEYIYNPDQKFSLASIIKAPYCMFVYELASQGLVDLEQVITFEEHHIAEGTGDIKAGEFGDEFTVDELIALAIGRSDNTAIEMLRDVAPLNDFIDYIKVTYSLDHHEDIKWALNSATDVKDIGAYATGVYQFMEVNPFGDRLKEYMVNSRNKMLYLPHTVAHKYGWTLEAFNELAIVYADNPYVLVICSKRVEGTSEDYKMFSSIGNTINTLQTQKYELLV